MISLEEPRRTSPWTPLLTSVDRAGQFVVPLLIVVAFRSDNLIETLVNSGVVTSLVVGTSWIAWLRLRWWVEGDRLRVRSGLLQIDDRTIPVDRIQRFDRNQSLMSRFFDLYTLDAETAGGSGSELSIKYLSAGDIDAFEEWINSHSDSAVAARADAVEPELIVAVPTRRLVLAGATANRIGALAVAVGTAFQIFDDATSDTFAIIERRFPAIAEVFSSGSGAIVAVIVLGLLALIVGWVASIGTTVARFFEFKLELLGDDLRRSHGLLSRFQATSPLRRVQAVRIDSPVLRRMLGYSSVVAETAGSPGGSAGGAGALTPISRHRDAVELTSRLVGPAPGEIETLTPVSRLTVRRGFIRSVFLTAPLAVSAAWFLARSSPLMWIGMLTSIGLASWWYARARYAALGFRVTDGHIVTREGVFTRRWWTVPLGKVQTVAVRRSPFQRRLGLATVSVDTAGGRAKIQVIDVPQAVAHRISSQLAARSRTDFNLDAV